MANIQERRDKEGRLISYSIRVHRGRDANGKQLKPWTATFKVSPTWKEDSARRKAETFAANFEKECREGTATDTRQTFASYCDYYIEMKESSGQKHSTICWYKEQTARIYPEIGHIKLKNLRADDLNRLYMKLGKTSVKATTAKALIDLPSVLKEQHVTREAIAQQTGLSVNTVRIAVRGSNCSVKTARAISDVLNLNFDKSFLVLNQNKALSGKTISGYHRFISSVLNQAVSEGLIPVNVATRAITPKIDSRDATSLQTGDLPSILAALEHEPMKWKVIVHLLLITGARRGEILGLKWSAVDFDNNRIHINNNVLYYPDVGIYQDKPKTKSSIRWIALPSDTMELLTSWKEYQKNDAEKKGDFYSNPEGLLFTQDNGSLMCPDSVTSWLRHFSKRHKLPHINPHKFRHTMASMLLYNKVDPVSVAKRLGHAQVSTTTDIYAHVIAEADKQNADLLSGIFLKHG